MGGAVSWITPDSPDQHARIDEWCRTVGPVIVPPGPDPAVVPRIEDAFVVVTWNSNVGRGDLYRLVADLREGRLTGERVTQFALLIQEARRIGASVPALAPNADVPKRLGDENGGDIHSAARTLGLNLAYAPAMRNGQGQEDRGNAILSTVPLDDVTVIELPLERQRRVAITAAARVTKRDGMPWTMRLVSVHLETRAGALRHGPASARRRQAEFLIDALGEPSGPTIVSGDFYTSWG